MSKKNDGGPAFPINPDLWIRGNSGALTNEEREAMPLNPECGMSLRDWFAGKALAGLVADGESDMAMPRMAEWSYEMADLMIAEREKEA